MELQRENDRLHEQINMLRQQQEQQRQQQEQIIKLQDLLVEQKEQNKEIIKMLRQLHDLLKLSGSGTRRLERRAGHSGWVGAMACCRIVIFR